MSKIEDYYKGWTRQLDIAEKKQDRLFSQYFYNEYKKMIDDYLVNRRVENVDAYFQLKSLNDLYKNLYVSIGNRMAKWYIKNYEKYINKNETEQYEDIWNQKFTYLGETVAGERIVSISGNRKKEFLRFLRKKMSDKDFQEMGEAQAGRILRKKFLSMSVMNAKRIVRTESVNAANYATNMTAVDVFGKDNLIKEWIASLDERTRVSHAAANGQQVNMNEKFIVMGEYLSHPGDSSGSAGNIINCRCTSAPIPKQSFTIN